MTTARYVINDFLWGSADEVREEGDQETVMFLPIQDDQELNLNPLVTRFIEKMWGFQYIGNDACADAIRAWAVQNRKFIQPRLNKIEWDHKLGGVPGKPDFGVYLFVEDKCGDSFYGHGDTEEGTEIWRNDDRDETPVLVVPYRLDQDAGAHKAFVTHVIDALNAIEEMRSGGGAYALVEYEDGFVVRPTYGA